MTAQVNDSSISASLKPSTWSDLTDTTPGIAALARLALVVCAGWVAIRPERVIDPATQLPALLIPGLAVATFGFTRTGGDLELVGYAMGILHALAMSVWFGGLVLLSRVVLAGPGEDDLVHAARGYAR
jgi:copper transport protein